MTAEFIRTLFHIILFLLVSKLLSENAIKYYFEFKLKALKKFEKGGCDDV
jgi:hypothetical protein